MNLRKLALLAFLAALFAFPAEAQFYGNINQPTQHTCLSDVMYREAGILRDKGMRAVGHAVINRTKDRRFPNTICEVVYHKLNGMPQFQWTVFRNLPPKDPAMYAQAKNIATEILNNDSTDATKNAVFFTIVTDGWFGGAIYKGDIILTLTIGPKRFYKFKSFLTKG